MTMARARRKERGVPIAGLRSLVGAQALLSGGNCAVCAQRAPDWNLAKTHPYLGRVRDMVKYSRTDPTTLSPFILP